MSLRLYTAQLSYGGDDRLDISRNGNHVFGSLFAPSVRLRNKAYTARKDQAWVEAYFREYRNEMRALKTKMPEAWQKMLERGEVTLCCYCLNSSACHRSVLARMLVEDGAEYEGERQWD